MLNQFKLKSQKNTVYLIDGNAYAYQAYYAIKNLSNSKGFPTNSIFGFTKMLIKLINKHSPKYAAILFDSPGKTFRHKQYKKYKSNRTSMPNDLKQQLPWIKKITRNFNIPIFEITGLEADDLIGTLSKKIEENGLSTIIVSRDKDLIQLITNNCTIWNPTKNMLINKKSIETKFEINPEQIIEVMGLSGDKVDNIPGIPGIGLKTALKLITKFNSIKECYKNLNNIPKKNHNKLKKFKYQATLSRKLSMIETNLPINFNISQLKISKPKIQSLNTIFKELNFKQLNHNFISKLNDKKKSYSIITNKNSLNKLLLKLKICKIFSLNTYTSSSKSNLIKLIGISISIKENKSYYIPIGHKYKNINYQIPLHIVLNNINLILSDHKIKKIGENIKHDSATFFQYGIKVKGIKFDTAICSHLLSPSHEQYNHKQTINNFVCNKTVPFNKIDINQTANYICKKTNIILTNSIILNNLIKKTNLNKLMTKIELPLIQILIQIENNGIFIEKSVLHILSLTFQKRLELLTKKIYNTIGYLFNINSSQQLAKILFKQLALPLNKNTKNKKNFSTNSKVLTELSRYHKLPNLILKYRSLSKLKSTHIDALLNQINSKTNKIHTLFNQIATITGRLSSANPNLQNIPTKTLDGKKIRKAFITKPKCYILLADYSQIELRILAHYSSDIKLLNAFKNGKDIHIQTASEIFHIDPEMIDRNLRQQAKTINFGIIYGMSSYTLAEKLKINNSTAKNYIEKYFNQYKGVKKFIDLSIKKAIKTKQTTTLLGRTRDIPNILSTNKTLKKFAERTAINTPIQGTAADLIKLAMINLNKKFNKTKFKTKMILSVHDEIIFETPPNEIKQISTVIKKEMESIFNLKVPLKVNISYGKNWEKSYHKFKIK